MCANNLVIQPLRSLRRTFSTMRSVGDDEDHEERQRAQRCAGHDRAVGLGAVGGSQEGECHRQRDHLRLVHRDQGLREIPQIASANAAMEIVGQVITQIENGVRRSASVSALRRLAEALGVPVTETVG